LYHDNLTIVKTFYYGKLRDLVSPLK